MFEPLFLDVCNVKQILKIITRTRLFWKSYLVCSNVNERLTRGMALDKLLLYRSSMLFALQVILGSLVAAIAYFLSLKARNSVNF